MDTFHKVKAFNSCVLSTLCAQMCSYFLFSFVHKKHIYSKLTISPFCSAKSVAKEKEKSEKNIHERKIDGNALYLVRRTLLTIHS